MAAKGRRGWWRAGALVASVLLTLLILGWLAVTTYLSYRRASTELILDHHRQAAILAAIRLRDELTKFSDELAILTRSKDLNLGLLGRQKAALRAASNRLSVFDGGIILMDGFGKVRAAEPSRPELMGEDWSDRDFFRELLANPTFRYTSAPDIGPDGTSVVVVSVPIVGDSGELFGALAGMFRLGQPTVSSFYASIVRLRIAGSGNTYVVDGSGRILFDSGYARIGEYVTLPWGKASDVRGGAMRTVDPDGNPIILSYAPVPGTGWSLLIEDDWSGATRGLRRYAGGLVALLVIGLLVPAIGIVVLFRNQRMLLTEYDAATQEAQLAASMRKRLVPPQSPLVSGWRLAVHYQTPGESGPKDIYDLILLRDGRLAVTLTSVDQSGVAGMQVMATARASFRAAAWRGASPAGALAQCNTVLCPDVDPASAVASMYALLDPDSGRLQASTAGLPAPFVWSNGRLNRLSTATNALGCTVDSEYPQDDIILGPGDAVIFGSRGWGALMDLAGEEFTSDRIGEAIATHARAPEGADMIAQAMIDGATAFLGQGMRPGVDLTVIVLVRDMEPVGEMAPPRRVRRNPMLALAETETDL